MSRWAPGHFALRSEHWRYIRYNDGSEELYDHRSDPKEWKNLIREKSPERQALIEDFTTFLQRYQ